MRGSTFRPFTIDGISDFEPVTGWRWWFHFGANETRLMHPRKPLPEYLVMAASAFEALSAAARQAGRSMVEFGEAWKKAASR